MSRVSILISLIISIAAVSASFGADAPFSVNFEGIQFSIVEQAPHLNATPLQTFGVFEYKKGDGFGGADIEVDEVLHGNIQHMRKSHLFEGRLGENILLKPKDSKLVPKQLLVMGLGDPVKLKASDMNQVGATDIREVCRLGLTEFAHASDVQDGGVKRISAGIIAENVLIGMIQALRLQKYLADNGMADACGITQIAYLAGPKYFKETTAALTRVTRSMGQTPPTLAKGH